MSPAFSRREMLKGASLAALGIPAALAQSNGGQTSGAASESASVQDQTRAQRMQWWHAARFGMFIHFGVYSTIRRHEWVMEDEAIPMNEYVPHAMTFQPALNCPRAWAKLAQAGRHEVHGDDHEAS